jgi:pimeloyl-ACP methyl ester carboxylesterase
MNAVLRDPDRYLDAGPGLERIRYRDSGAAVAREPAAGSDAARGTADDPADGASTPAVLLLHGWALDLGQWDDVADALANAFRVVRIDRPGFGESSGAPSAEADARAIAATVDALALAPVALIACSQAGRGALRYALRAPRAVAALVLEGVPLEGFAPGPEAEDAAPIAELTSLLERQGLGAVRTALAAHAFFRLHGADAATNARLASMLGRYRAADLVTAAADAPVNVAARLAELTMPTLVLNGEFDTPHRRLMGEALAYGLPRAERTVLNGAGHLAALERPREYADLLRGFLLRQLNHIGR